MHVLTLIKTNSRTPDMEERENREKAYAAHGGKCGSLHHPGFSSVILSPISNTEFRTCKNKILGKGRNTEFRTCRNKILGEEGERGGERATKPTCELLCHLSSLSSAMLVHYWAPDQVERSPNRVSLLIQYTWKIIGSRTQRSVKIFNLTRNYHWFTGKKLTSLHWSALHLGLHPI